MPGRSSTRRGCWSAMSRPAPSMPRMGGSRWSSSSGSPPWRMEGSTPSRQARTNRAPRVPERERRLRGRRDCGRQQGAGACSPGLPGSPALTGETRLAPGLRGWESSAAHELFPRPHIRVGVANPQQEPCLDGSGAGAVRPGDAARRGCRRHVPAGSRWHATLAADARHGVGRVAGDAGRGARLPRHAAP